MPDHYVHYVLYGGSFDPPTKAHVAVVESFLATGITYDCLYVMPTYKHAYGKQLTAFRHRMLLCAAAFSEFVGRGLGVRLHSMDQKIVSDPPGSMYSLCSQFIETCEDPTRLSIIIGYDQAIELVDKWDRGSELLELVNVLVVPRAGLVPTQEQCPWLYGTNHRILPAIPEHLAGVSSTLARKAIIENDTVSMEAMIPAKVIPECLGGIYHD